MRFRKGAATGLLPVGQVRSKISTTLTGGGSSVVGNVSVAFIVAVVIGGAVGITLAIMGHPDYALGSIALAVASYYPFQFLTLRHVAQYPDSSVTSEEHYARVIEAKMMSAKDPKIIEQGQMPVIGASEPLVAIAQKQVEHVGQGNE